MLSPNDILPSGLTRFRHREIARSSGYQGDFGSGQHANFLRNNPDAAKSFSAAVAREVDRTARIAGTAEAFSKTSGQVSALQAAKAGLSFTNLLGKGAGLVDDIGSGVAPSVFKPSTSLPGPAAGTGTLSLSGAATGLGVGLATGTILSQFTPLKEEGAQIGGAAGGAAAGSGLLAGIGIAGGPLGIIIGSVVGSAIGGLFGPEPPVNASQFFGQFDDSGGFGEFRTASKTIGTEQGQSVGSAFETFTSEIASTIGANLAGVQVFGGYNDKYEGGFFIRTDTAGGGESDIRERFDPKDQASTLAAFGNTFDRLIRQNASNQVLVSQIDAQKAQGKSTLDAIYAIYESAKGQAVNKTPAAEIESKVEISQKQFDNFIEKVKSETAGRKQTIFTGPRGLLEEPETFRPQLAAA